MSKSISDEVHIPICYYRPKIKWEYDEETMMYVPTMYRLDDVERWTKLRYFPSEHKIKVRVL